MVSQADFCARHRRESAFVTEEEPTNRPLLVFVTTARDRRNRWRHMSARIGGRSRTVELAQHLRHTAACKMTACFAAR
jgi:hypothetical protein